MKKIVLLSLAACLLAQCDVMAQTKPIGPQKETKRSADTTVNTDTTTVIFYGMGDNLVSIDAEAKLLTGTIGGKIYLWGRTGAQYNLLDSSAVLTATAYWKTFLFDKTKWTYYNDYKLEYRTTTTQTSWLLCNALRRPGEGD